MTLERWISPAFSNLRVSFSGDNPRDRWISPAFSHLRFMGEDDKELISVFETSDKIRTPGRSILQSLNQWFLPDVVGRQQEEGLDELSASIEWIDLWGLPYMTNSLRSHSLLVG
ncbi:hypothetical protein HanRHA438_Chr04g0158241 [Helianthus annuus]|uniref:uncharacterized protein LOC110934461 n=1 Tax=Helianthus annuus TaxID=4232 RepID=UPI001652D4FA|nr:uncharacterized protein LOC110934461 [Helianthus annuus]XP_035845449.1 uncharacterized protein LOC110934461 [Helianthus annuus]XP_035845450.1 uncharacterized protein LOC110934461 [Helianthus annuus]KAJ0925304.1 hypothetical protein HanRHA438_Chr04g0158241 [Helianthus annuus]